MGSNAEEMKIKEAKGYIKFALGENVKLGIFNKISRWVWNKSFMMLLQTKNTKSWEKYNSLSYIENKKQSPEKT